MHILREDTGAWACATSQRQVKSVSGSGIAALARHMCVGQGHRERIAAARFRFAKHCDNGPAGTVTFLSREHTVLGTLDAHILWSPIPAARHFVSSINASFELICHFINARNQHVASQRCKAVSKHVRVCSGTE